MERQRNSGQVERLVMQIIINFLLGHLSLAIHLQNNQYSFRHTCLLYTSDAADE